MTTEHRSVDSYYAIKRTEDGWRAKLILGGRTHEAFAPYDLEAKEAANHFNLWAKRIFEGQGKR